MLGPDGKPITNAAPARDERVSRSTRDSGIPTTPRAKPTATKSAPASTPAAPPKTTRPAPPPQPSATKPAAPPPVGSGNPGYAQQVLELTNAQRTAAGCPALTMNSELTAAAQGHSQDMADRDYFEHNSPDGQTPWDRAHAEGYANPSGENIAVGYQTPQEVMDAWMASEGHRENILNCESKEMGLGYVDDPGRGPLWTQLFGFG